MHYFYISLINNLLNSFSNVNYLLDFSNSMLIPAHELKKKSQILISEFCLPLI